MSMYWIIFIGFALLSWLVSSRLQNKFEKYSKIPMPNGMTGSYCLALEADLSTVAVISFLNLI